MLPARLRSATLLCLLAVSSAPAQAGDVPNIYRGIYQAALPLNEATAITAAAGLVRAPAFDQWSLIGVPAGVEHKFNDWLSVQSYLMLNHDILSRRPDKLEVRPVLGITAKHEVTPNLEIGAWLRYEARFQDVTGRSTFQNRLRLRPYVEYQFGDTPGKPGTVRAKLEVEPKYIIDDRFNYLNAVMPRLSLGYVVSPTLSFDVRVSREWGRATPGAKWRPTQDMVTLHIVQVLGVEHAKARRLAEIDD
ncbi:hypothetical protein [uncultured Alsobacter sp.]|uniref:hypothetical protein n=1 Tax=uncultured Alsobacter sp. TaxID=1748258 RepID=UPI0025CE004F|nr:hypothetical protein [uncultured Alsobacter sp.]